MKGKVVKFFWKDISNDHEYGEDVPIPPNEPDAETYINRIIVEFNAEEDRRHEANSDYLKRKRKLISVHGETGKSEEILIYCESTKFNLMTINRGNEVYDLYQCKNCLFFRKRHSVEWHEEHCYPDRVCIKCNKLFTSVRNLAFHNKRDGHRLPVWYPDGV